MNICSVAQFAWFNTACYWVSPYPYNPNFSVPKSLIWQYVALCVYKALSHWPVYIDVIPQRGLMSSASLVSHVWSIMSFWPDRLPVNFSPSQHFPKANLTLTLTLTLSLIVTLTLAPNPNTNRNCYVNPNEFSFGRVDRYSWPTVLHCLDQFRHVVST